MSGPNSEYDPVQVTPLKAPSEVAAMRDAALAAIAAAADLDELKQARLEHAGDRSPLALANREIGALPPQARKDAGQRIGRPAARWARRSPSDRRRSRPRHEQRMLVDEAVDITLAYGPRARSAPGTR